jgi:tRNA pseudouridine13 synthase
LKPGLISYAGIKDKRAKTCQRIAVSNVEANRLIGISLYAKGLKLGNYEYGARPIALGDLKGNHFRILLKNVRLHKEEAGQKGEGNVDISDVVKEAIATIKTKGFINYFGMQRFGSYEISTAEIGKKILQQSWLEVSGFLNISL